MCGIRVQDNNKHPNQLNDAFPKHPFIFNMFYNLKEWVRKSKDQVKKHKAKVKNKGGQCV